ncbi:MAG: hypothetical protein GC131_08270 [Alphaproteobacteria bacterium]|nr:hypothetical protein [Alphaproteobacteria bacterium]
MTKIAIIGARGKMGQLATEAVGGMAGCSVVASVGRGDDLQKVLAATKPDIAIEVSSHLSVKENSLAIIKAGVRPIIGASGLVQSDIEELAALCSEKKLGGVVAPNFSVGMACFNKLARDLGRYFKDISIVEYHHAGKKDKPSGTARYTAGIAGLDPAAIASVRGDGFLAKQQLYASTPDERIVIDHESFSRRSFIAGIVLCAEKAMKLDRLVVGMEHLLGDTP